MVRDVGENGVSRSEGSLGKNKNLLRWWSKTMVGGAVGRQQAKQEHVVSAAAVVPKLPHH